MIIHTTSLPLHILTSRYSDQFEAAALEYRTINPLNNT